METIAWIGFSQGLFAAILMLTKKEQSVADKLLTAWLSLLAIEFMTCALDNRIFGVPMLSSSFLLFNPAFYLYVKSLVTSSFKLHRLQLLHLIPFIFFKVFAYVLKEPYVMTGFTEADSTLWFRILFSLASVVSWLAYNYATAVYILRHRRKLVDEFSNIENNKRLGWLLFIVVFYNLYCILLVGSALLSILMDISFPLSPVYNYSTLLLLVYIFSFYGLKQQIIYWEYPIIENQEEKYSKSQLSAAKKVQIKNLIMDYFDNEKPYLNPELSMKILSEKLNIPKYQLTEVLNMEIGKNFFLFVNEYRTEAVKRLLLEANNPYSIEAIGYECGFNSKSSFFTVFKKLTGQTPMQFKNMTEE